MTPIQTGDSDGATVECGVEDPIGSNELLYSLDEASDEIAFGVSLNPNVRRYSFVWDNEPKEEAAQVAHRVINEVLARLCLPAYLVSVWAVHGDGTPQYRAVMKDNIEKKLLPRWIKQGWDVSERSGMTCAFKLISEVEQFTDWRRSLIIVGSKSPLDDVLAPEMYPVIERYALGGPAAPNDRFVEALAARKLTIGYCARELLSVFAFIFVGAHTISVDELIADGIIRMSYSGDEASRVWRFGEHE